MIAQVVTVFDRKTGTHSMPQFVASRGAALRSFQDEVNRSDAANVVYRHPEDFALYFIGEYNDAEGRLIPSEPECIANAVDLVVKVQ